MNSRTAPAPPGRPADEVHAGADRVGGVGRRRRDAGEAQHRQVHQVVAHVGDVVGGEALLGEDLGEGGGLVGRLLAHDRHAELPGPFGGRRRRCAPTARP